MDAGELLAETLRTEIVNLRRLSGGASRATYAFEADGRALILRTGTQGMPVGREAALMRSAAQAGVPTPEVVAGGQDFVVMEHVEGETIPRRILRDPPPGLAGQCGRILAGLHCMAPVEGLDETDPIETWTGVLDLIGEPHPALEYGLRWLTRNRPPTDRTAVVHGDFRNGNLIVGADGIRAVLDWELAHLGDPLEDLGWLCVKAWRFGSPLPVGGFGGYDELIEAYEAAGGPEVDRDALRWWEIFGVLKWGVICVMQADRHLSGGERSIELATIGRRTAENEWDLLHLIPNSQLPPSS